ncbi:MAG: hypothetical protein Q8S09_12270 [Hyphomonas sp.]|nr:hypothetical protein [Hyphomonas sp.]
MWSELEDIQGVACKADATLRFLLKSWIAVDKPISRRNSYLKLMGLEMKLLKIAALATAAALAACSTNPAKLVPEVARAEQRFDSGVEVRVSGAKPTIASNEDIQAAVETAIVNSGLFASAGELDYVLSADVLSIENPLMGVDLESKVRVAWSLRLRAQSEPVWKQQITSAATAKFGDHLVAAKRIAIANERAIAENSLSAVEQLSELGKADSTTQPTEGTS